MQPMVKVAAYVLSCGVVASTLSAMIPQQVNAAPGATSVKIVNAASEPVPVAGSVDARVSGSVGLAAGTSVGLSAGTSVTIGNSAGSPVPVREIGDGRQPIQGKSSGPAGNLGCIFSNGICA